MDSNKVQIITNRNCGDEWIKTGFDTNKFSSPNSFDSYSLNIIDFSDESLWYYDSSSSDFIHSANDLRSINRILLDTKKSAILIVLPQNVTCFYNRASIYAALGPIKDHVNRMKKSIAEATADIHSLTLTFENNTTTINSIDYKSDFSIDNSANFFEEKTNANESEKPTTVKMKDGYYFTTLDIMENAKKAKNYLAYLGLMNDTSFEEPPEWIKEIVFYNDKILNDQLTTIDNKIRELQKSKEIVLQKIEDNSRYKSVLYETGDALVFVVLEILEKILDCDFSDFVDKKDEDFKIVKEKITFIGEIKGITKNVKKNYISQVNHHCKTYEDELDEKGLSENIKGVLIVNHQRETAINEREQIPQPQIRLAEKYESLIVETEVLLKLYEEFMLEKITPSEIEKLFSEKTGLLEVTDFIRE